MFISSWGIKKQTPRTAKPWKTLMTIGRVPLIADEIHNNLHVLQPSNHRVQEVLLQTYKPAVLAMPSDTIESAQEEAKWSESVPCHHSCVKLPLKQQARLLMVTQYSVTRWSRCPAAPPSAQKAELQQSSSGWTRRKHTFTRRLFTPTRKYRDANPVLDFGERGKKKQQ